MNAQDLTALLPPVHSIEEWLDHQVGEKETEGPLARGRHLAPEGDASARSRILGRGLEAARRLKSNHGVDHLTGEEQAGLEALVVLVGRPALRIDDGRLLVSPPPGWEILDSCRDQITRASLAVGRIELLGHPTYPWAGTGFLVAPDIVMTNRHVVKAFSSHGESGRWEFQPGVTASVDRADEPDHDPPLAHRVKEIVAVHESLDLALLRVEPGDEILPLRLMAHRSDLVLPLTVATIGYPANDPRNDPVTMRELFGDLYGVKRLQPGMINEILPDERVLRHDCSTLGGNSGSCVIDLVSGDVIGLHFRGFYMKYNEAVALSWLHDDPLLMSLGLVGGVPDRDGSGSQHGASGPEPIPGNPPLHRRTSPFSHVRAVASGSPQDQLPPDNA